MPSVCLCDPSNQAICRPCRFSARAQPPESEFRFDVDTVYTHDKYDHKLRLYSATHTHNDISDLHCLPNRISHLRLTSQFGRHINGRPDLKFQKNNLSVETSYVPYQPPTPVLRCVQNLCFCSESVSVRL